MYTTHGERRLISIWCQDCARLVSYESAEMMLSKPSSIKKGCYIYQWLDNIDIYYKQSNEIQQNIY